MKFKIKIIFDFDEGLYKVFVDGIKDLEGHGETEIQAISDFFNNYDEFKDKEYFSPILIQNMKEKYKMLDSYDI